MDYLRKKEGTERIEYPTTGSCLDCDWQGNMEDAETDPCGDYDEFKGVNISTKICPKCEGGVEMI